MSATSIYLLDIIPLHLKKEDSRVGVSREKQKMNAKARCLSVIERLVRRSRTDVNMAADGVDRRPDNDAKAR